MITEEHQILDDPEGAVEREHQRFSGGVPGMSRNVSARLVGPTRGLKP